jgi:O-succinylbenzoic acid--CoA ligase
MSPASVSFPDWLASRAFTNPERSALSADGQRWNYAQLDGEATRLARKIASFGVKRGDRVATLLHNQAIAAILPHALLRLGATIVPLNVRLTDRELAWQVENAAPRLMIVDERTRSLIQQSAVKSVDVAHLAAADEADVGMRFDHPADFTLAIIYTSGTTGRPKGAMLSVANFWWSAIGSALNLGVHDDDRWMLCLPMFHVGGLSIVMRAAIYGIEASILDGFDAARVNAGIDGGGTIVSVVAVMLDRMIEQRGNRPYPPTLRCVLLGGGPAPSSLLERCEKLGIPAVQTYGLTETCSQVATLSPDQARSHRGAAGKPIYPNAIRIRGGEIEVRGPIVMQGYFNEPEASSSAIRDGWLKTGDIGEIDSEGFLRVLDRREDLIVTGGENVYPAEVEAVLTAHDAVIEAAVVGSEDVTWGQRVVAFVRTSAPIDAESLDEHCRAALAGYKVPREFRFVASPLPRTASGKVRRNELRGATR